MEVFLSSFIPLVLIIQTLQVQGQAPGIVLEPEMKNGKLSQAEGDSFSVSCKLTPETPDNDSPNNVFAWFDAKGEKVVELSSGVNPHLRSSTGQLDLSFRQLSTSDTGKYKCTVKTASEQYEKEFMLELRASVKVTDCPVNQNGLLGTEQNIKCIASAGGAGMTADWEFNGMPIDKNDSRYMRAETSLRILNVTLQSEGKYSFIGKLVEKGGEDKIVDIQFKVVEKPRFDKPASEKQVTVGDRVQMFCVARGRPTPETITWTKEDSTNVIKNTGTMRASDGTKDANGFQKILTIDKVEPEHRGKYICTAYGEVVEGQELTATHSVTLDVQIPPTVQIEAIPKGTEGTGAVMICVAHGDPAPEMGWKVKGTGVQYFESHSDSDGRIKVVKSSQKENNNIKVTFTLSFTKVQMSDAATYICQALNDAGQAEKEAEFIVDYGPKFIETQTQFYTWRPLKEATDTVTELKCKTNSNPLASYEWHKDGVKMASTTTDIDPNDPHISTTTLSVSYTGTNSDAIGEYVCKAQNYLNVSEVSITLAIADVPPVPEVQVYEEEASRYIFWLKVGNVVGPPVEGFKVVYTQDASDAVDKTQSVGIDKRPHMDKDRQYTQMIVEGLVAKTAYTFTFYTVSPAGDSNGKEMKLSTPDIRPPGKVNILTQTNVDTVTYIILLWEKPSTGGAVIEYYEIKYQKVAVEAKAGLANMEYKDTKPLGGEITISKIAKGPYRLEKLEPNTYYRISVYAHNTKGNGTPGTKIIKTAEANPVPGSSTGKDDGLSTGAIIGIVIAIFFILLIIVDVTCYLKNNCGILMSIKEKVTGSRGDEGYSAAKTDDVENLAKKDELTEEAKAAEEGEVADMAEEEKKEPLLSEEQKVDTVDEGETAPEKKELDPDEKEAKKEEESKAEEAPAEDKKEEAPADKTEDTPPAEKPAEEKPAEEKPAE